MSNPPEESNAEIVARLIIGTITNTEFLKRLKPMWDPSLVGSGWRWIAAQSFQWLEEHGEAIGRNIELRWASRPMDEDTKQDLEGLLERLNTEYEADTQRFDTDELVKLAARYFRKQYSVRQVLLFWQAVEADRMDEAEKLLEEMPEKFKAFSNDSQGLPVMEESEFLAVERPEPKVLLDPWLTEASMFEIYADRGVGKSYLLYTIALMLTRKTEHKFLPTIGPWKLKNKSGVLLVDGEMPDRLIEKRLKELGDPMGGPDPRHPLCLWTQKMANERIGRDINLEKKEDRDRITQTLEKRPAVKVLLLDNLTSLFPGMDENSREAWGPVNAWLIHLRAKLGVTVGFAHHANKSGGQRGTSGREDNLDIVLKLEATGQMGDLCEFKVKFEKCRHLIGPDMRSFRIGLAERDETGKVWCPMDMAKNGDRMPTKTEEALILLIEGRRGPEIMRILGCSASTVTKAKKEGCQRHYLDKTHKPTAKGLQWRNGIGSEAV